LAFIDIFRPRLTVFSSTDIQGIFVHSVGSWTLLLASCSCSCLLHVVVSLICIFLVSRQLVLLSALPRYPYLLVAKKGASSCSSQKSHLDLCQSLFRSNRS
jgi:hypothetical protein